MAHYNIEGLIAGATLGIMAAVCAITVSKRFIFKPFRLWAKNTGNEWFAELCGCHWCLVFWFSGLCNVVFYPNTIIPEANYPEWVTKVIAFVASQFWIFAIGTITLRVVFDRGNAPEK